MAMVLPNKCLDFDEHVVGAAVAVAVAAVVEAVAAVVGSVADVAVAVAVDSCCCCCFCCGRGCSHTAVAGCSWSFVSNKMINDLSPHTTVGHHT
jgi:hypothetical protein